MIAADVNLVLVQRQDALQALADRLQSVPAFGVDTEANSLYRYHAHVCLIQVSVPGFDYIVDPLAVDPRPLAAAFASAEVQKVMHAGEYDIMCLRRDYGFGFRHVFDTMIAARTLGMDRFGLAPLLQAHFGVSPDKRYQRADWGQRPLPDSLLSYAAVDSHYLLALRDLLRERLAAAGSLAAAQQEFRELCQVVWHPKPFDRCGFMRLPGARRLDRVQLAVLRELYLWREQTAEAVDRPAFRVARPDLLVRLAMMQPHTVAALEMLVPRRDELLLRRAAEVVECVCRGRASKEPVEMPGLGRRRSRRRPRAYRRLERWRREQAGKLDVAAEEVLPTDAIGLLVRRHPRTPAELKALGCLDAEQLAEHGSELLGLLGDEGGGD